MPDIFDELDQRMGIVPRWSILRTVQQQNVAMHCFNVERIAVQMALLWFDIDDGLTMTQISQYALHHDDAEALTGDIPSTAKVYLKEDYEDTSGIWHNNNEQAKQIVKLADLMEAYWFLATETKMGNSYIFEHLVACRGKAREYAQEHFDHNIAALVEEWMSAQLSERSQRHD
jgi:5'-deoxynucleotidase YfbR-like HD superfamily hydrolase